MARQEFVFIYFMAANLRGQPAIKIGYSAKPKKRGEQLSRWVGGRTEVLCAIPCLKEMARGFERQIHERFAEYRIVGEWFEPAQEILGASDGARLAGF